MGEPTRSAPTFWGDERSPGEQLWVDVERALRDELVYWLTTVTATGRPISRPVWGVWLDDHLMLSVGSVTHWANVVDGGRDHVSVNLPSDTDVVVVQGVATSVDDLDELAEYCDVYNAKYRWIFTPETAGPTFRVAPDKVISWTTRPATEGTPDMDFPDTAGRWTFD